METFGLLVEFVFLGIGVYLYLFSIGKIKSKDPDANKKVEAYRVSNAKWLRPLALLLIAIMLVNIILHILQLI